MDPISAASAVGIAVGVARLALEVYQKGFTRLEQAAPAHDQYLEFGNAIHGLRGNLDALEKIVQDAGADFHRIPSYERSQAWNLQGLEDILGNYRSTLDSCESLIRNNRDLEKDSLGFVCRVRWSTGLETEVARLTRRVAFHNVKILLVLEPFKQSLLLENHARLDVLEDDVVYLINQQKRVEARINLLLATARPGYQARDPLTSAIFEVPPELKDKFQAVSVLRLRTQGLHGPIPLRRWLDAFAVQFEEGRTSLDLDTYLRLMKSIWILQNIQGATEYTRIPPDSLLHRYVKRLKRKLERQCELLLEANSTLPDLALVLLRPDEDFALVWDDGTDTSASSITEGPSLPELLNVQLYSEDDRFRKDLRVYRNLNGNLLLKSSRSSTAPNDATILEQGNDLFLNQACFTPLYVVPTARTNIHRVLLKNGKDGTALEFRFNSPKDLYAFQQIVTQHNIVFFKSAIEAQCYIGSQDQAPIHYGIVQIWQAVQETESQSRRGSTSTTSTNSESITSPARGQSRLSFSSRTSTSSTRRSDLASLMASPYFARPRESAVVLPLRSQEQTSADVTDQVLSLMSIILDVDTKINPRRCQCHRQPESCTYAVIEREKGLLARRVEAERTNNGLENLNLAAVGAYQIDGQVVMRNVKRVRIKFDSVADRKNFVSTFESVRKVYVNSLERHEQLRRLIYGTSMFESES